MSWQLCGASATHEVYPYCDAVTHGDSQSVHVAAPFRYAETHETLEFVRASKLETAALRDASPVSMKFGKRHSLREGPAVIGASDATCVDAELTVVESEGRGYRGDG